MIRFLLDMGVAQSTGEFLRSLGHDAVRSLESGALVADTDGGIRIRTLPVDAD